MNMGNGLDVNGINYISIFIWSDSASESGLDLSAWHDGVMWVRVDSRREGLEHIGHKELAEVVETFGEFGIVSMCEGQSSEL